MNICCSQCLSVNRVPPERLRDKPVCGKCGQSLLPDHPIELNDHNFDKFVARTELPVLVDFWAPWCGPCRMMASEFAEASRRVSPQAILAKLDTEAAPQTASRFQITGIPTMILFKAGREAARQSGAVKTPKIVALATR